MAELHDLPPSILRELDPCDRPHALRVYEALREEIQGGDLEPGRVLSYRELAQRHAISRDAVAAAVGLLRVDGLMETRRRVGARVVVEGQPWEPPKDAASHIEHIEQVMRERLANGVYPVGTRVPTRTALASEFGVNDALVAEALRPLLDEGYLMTTRRRQDGTTVTALVESVPRRQLLCLALRPRYEPDALYLAWGERKTLRDWGNDPRCVVRPGTLKRRVVNLGWPVAKALTTPRVK